jgi:GT2 family glycosyltransferase
MDSNVSRQNYSESESAQTAADPVDGHRGAWPEEHPWWKICLSLDSDQPKAAWQRLHSWQEHGVPMECVNQLLAENAERDQPLEPARVNRSANNSNIQLGCFGTSLLDWQAHAWLQRCDLPSGFELKADSDATKVGLNLEQMERWLCMPKQLLTLTEYDSIWDPDPRRVAIFRALGISSYQLKAANPANGWLDRVDDMRDAMMKLGLPDPRSLTGPEAVLVLGNAEDGRVGKLYPPLQGWPGFDDIKISDENSARLLASWLEHCSRLGIQIVRLRPTPLERESRGFESLSIGNAPHQLKAQFFHGALNGSVLNEELSWRRNGRPASRPAQTPTPKKITAWESKQSSRSTASICISLYNYQDKVSIALESAKNQSEPSIELIIVDDASTDHSLETTLIWLRKNYHRFTRTLLLRHSQNSGLAATRNTAFEASSSEWIFVLDADNSLHPKAVEQCLRVASYADEKIAIVHPLIERLHENEAQGDRTTLISGLSWQESQLLHGNYIDAMALVRKKSWESVSGYSHIEDGWEDYDFWCKLIEAGFQGVLCPQVLAAYICHERSMIANRTDRNVRQISRLLQARHPWLELPMAADDA